MAKIVCSYSGVPFSCEHLPLSIAASSSVQHPIFHIPRRKLLSLAGQWSAGKLTPTESYLLYLSFFNSTGLIEWRTSARYHERTSQIVANNMEQLIHMIGRIDAIQHPSFTLPHFGISSDTCGLENSYHWIQIWQQNYNDWTQNIKDHANDQELITRELALQRLLKSSHKRIEDYPGRLASWARVAGDFPENITVTIQGVKQSLADYWESIIIKCAKAEQIFLIPANDLQELIEHCEDNVVADGSIFAMALMKFLRKGRMMQDNYLGLGDLSLAARTLTSYTILPRGASAESANLQNMIDKAPKSEPQKHHYPDLISFIRAKSAWIAAEAARKMNDLGKELGGGSDGGTEPTGDI